MRAGEWVGGRFLLQDGPMHGGGDQTGEVWLAHDEHLGRDVVLKRVAGLVRVGGPARISDRPTGEPRAMARINHQHVVTLYEYLSIAGGAEDAGDWLVMEYAPQGSLAGKPHMSPEQAARVGAQIASALVDLHAKGIVHCDIKPANIVIAENGAAKLTDFGAAYRVDDEETITPETQISYTPAYAAPEVVRGNPSRASDVYSLATTVYTLVAGESPHLPGHDESGADLGPLTDVLSIMRRRQPDERPDATRAQRMFENVAAGLDPMIDLSSPASVRTETSGSVVPAQLPTDVSGFAGRDDELDRLDHLLTNTVDEQPTAVVISAISGTAGVGKTALAVHWAHRVAERFPDGQLYVNLRGFDPSGQVLDPGIAVRGFLEALGTAPEQIPTELDAQTALYRSLLVGKKVLVVLDDARDTNQIRPLLPGTPGCLVVVTSRNDLTGLVIREGAHPFVLDLLSPVDARHLLERRLGSDRLAAEPEAVDQLIAACARLPLGLAIVAARAAIRPALPLAGLVAELRDSQSRLDALALEAPDADVRAVFSWSYEQLTSEAARLFRLLGPHPGPDTSALAAASLAGIPLPQAKKLLAELTRTHVASESVPGRYALHDLLRTYAAELAHTIDTDAERRAAQRRVLDHYVHTAHSAARLINQSQDPIQLDPPVTGALVEAVEDHAQAMAWFSSEHRVLSAAIDHAAGAGFDAHVWQLAWAFANFLDRLARWQDRVTVWGAALEAASRLDDLALQARAHRNLANGYVKVRNFDEARTNLEHALRLHGELGDHAGQAHTHRVLSFLYVRQGQHEAALQQAREALAIYEAIEHLAGQANAYNEIGWYEAQLGQYDKSVAASKRALTLHQELGDPTSEAATWDTLGFAHHHLGDHHEAIRCYQQALELLGKLVQRDDKAVVLDHLGDAQHALGDQSAARSSWQHALATLEELGDPDADAVRAKLRRLEAVRPDADEKY